jgi:acetyl-CoA acetyltransferase
MTEYASLGNRTAIVGVGNSEFGRFPIERSPVSLVVDAFKMALEDAGIDRNAVDGILVNIGTPFGVDYDQVSEAMGLDIRFSDQTWTHGRQMSTVLAHASMAVYFGLADYVACVCGINWARAGSAVGAPGQFQDDREIGGAHFENPPYGMSSPGAAYAMAAQLYFDRYGATSADLAEVPVQIRQHAMLNPLAVRRDPLTVEDHQASRFVCEPLHLYDYCQTTGGACVVIVAREDRARDGKGAPVWLAGYQGMHAGLREATGSRPGLGVHQQDMNEELPRAADLAVFERSGISRNEIDGFYTYDAMSSIVWMALERWGYCKPGEAWEFVKNGRIGPGGELPVNTHGGLLSETHVSSWNHICEMVRQLRGECGDRQIPDAQTLQWGTNRGDSVIMTKEQYQ